MPLDINLLPPEYRRPFLSFRGRFYLLVASLALLSLFPIFILRIEAVSEIGKLERELKILTDEEKKLMALEPKVKELNKAIDEARIRWEGMRLDHEIVIQRKWPLVLDAVKVHLPVGVSLTSVVQKGERLEIKGSALSLSHLALYLSSLEATRLFSKILLSYEHPKEVLSFTLLLEVKR